MHSQSSASQPHTPVLLSHEVDCRVAVAFTQPNTFHKAGTRSGYGHRQTHRFPARYATICHKMIRSARHSQQNANFKSHKCTLRQKSSRKHALFLPPPEYCLWRSQPGTRSIRGKVKSQPPTLFIRTNTRESQTEGVRQYVPLKSTHLHTVFECSTVSSRTVKYSCPDDSNFAIWPTGRHTQTTLYLYYQRGRMTW